MSHRSLEEDIALSSSLDILITAYQKVSVNRMQKTRRQVLAARKFTETLAGVYSDVRASQHHVSIKTIRDLLFKKQGQKSTHNQTPLVIMISSNNRLDGGISRAIFQDFSKYVKDRKCDIIITGEIGASLFRERFNDRPFKHIKLPKDLVSQANILPLVQLTKNYINVKIFYGKFINFIKQEPTVADLSDETLFNTDNDDKSTQSYVPFIFEPSLPDIISFFDTQILSALISRTTQEGNLAEHGSRVTAMELARQKVDSLLDQFSEETLRNKKTIQNKRQQEQFAGLMLWQTK